MNVDKESRLTPNRAEGARNFSGSVITSFKQCCSAIVAAKQKFRKVVAGPKFMSWSGPA